jgi:hypothetical protein
MGSFLPKNLLVVQSEVKYLGRYTHKITISNHKIKHIDAQNVTIDYKDYREKDPQKIKKQMTLSHQEFIRRFALHILPKRFVKIRHYGFLSSTWKRQKLKLLQEKLKVKVLEKVEKKPYMPKCACCCKVGTLHTLKVFAKRGPPDGYLGLSQKTSSSKS